MKKSLTVVSIVLIVLFIDQALKIWVKTHFCYGEERPLFGNSSWAKLNFVENPGMAFGWKFGGEYGKLALSLFRIVAIGFLGFNGDFNHAIMIRTFLSQDNKLIYQAGAGVVAKSVPENELQEVNNKLEALRKAITMAEKL